VGALRVQVVGVNGAALQRGRDRKRPDPGKHVACKAREKASDARKLSAISWTIEMALGRTRPECMAAAQSEPIKRALSCTDKLTASKDFPFSCFFFFFFSFRALGPQHQHTKTDGTTDDVLVQDRAGIIRAGYENKPSKPHQCLLKQRTSKAHIRCAYVYAFQATSSVRPDRMLPKRGQQDWSNASRMLTNPGQLDRQADSHAYKHWATIVD
jgi:hypothetical protein